MNFSNPTIANYSKQILFTLIIIGVSSVFSFAQNTDNALPQNGNIGVGTMNPQTKLQVVGKTNLQGTLTVDSAMTLHDSLTVKKTLNVAKTIRVGGNATLQKRLTVKQDVLIGGKTTLTGTTKMLGNAKILGTTILEKRLTVKQDLLIGGKATFSQFSRFDKNVKVKGITTLQNKLNVTGIATFKNRLMVLKSGRFKSKLTVDGFTRIKGNARLDGTVKFTALADTAATAQEQFLMVQRNGQIKSLKKKELIPLFYGFKACNDVTLADLPQWTAIKGTTPKPFKTLYTGICFPTRVGIGTATPETTFHLIGNSKTEGNATITKTVTANDGLIKNKLQIGTHALNFGKLDSLNNNIWTANGDLTLQGGASNNTSINPNGGRIGIGITNHFSDVKVMMQSDLKVGLCLVKNDAVDFNYGVKTVVNRANTKAIAVVNSTITSTNAPGGEDVFRVWGDGKVQAKKVEVLLTGWSDYVFKNDYNLKPLTEVENYISQNNHLPDVPSEKEVLENGIDLGEMNKILLQKIEELTLYTIEQQKAILELQNEVKNLLLK